MTSSHYPPYDHERTSSYNGIADGDGPDFIYRSNNLPTPFPKPVGTSSQTPIKRSMYHVGNTPLKRVWSTVGPQVCDIVKAAVPDGKYTCITPVRFCTYVRGPDGFTRTPDPDSIGPVTIWIGVQPGSTSADTAHDASEKILALLHDHEIDDVVLEWTEAVIERL